MRPAGATIGDKSTGETIRHLEQTTRAQAAAMQQLKRQLVVSNEKLTYARHEAEELRSLLVPGADPPPRYIRRATNRHTARPQQARPLPPSETPPAPAAEPELLTPVPPPSVPAADGALARLESMATDLEDERRARQAAEEQLAAAAAAAERLTRRCEQAQQRASDAEESLAECQRQLAESQARESSALGAHSGEQEQQRGAPLQSAEAVTRPQPLPSHKPRGLSAHGPAVAPSLTRWSGAWARFRPVGGFAA